MKQEIELLIYLVIYHALNCFADTQSKAGIQWEMNLMDKETKDYLSKKMKELRRKVLKAKKFEKKKDWKEFRVKVNREKINEDKN